MVGVPRSKGCNACREQKKRCVVEASPPCARCTRLNIDCVGYGQRRLKFQQEYPNRPVKNGAAKKDHSSALILRGTGKSRSQPSPYSKDYLSSILKIPTNDADTLASSLIYCLAGVDVDPRFQLSWSFGDFLDLLPQYVGLDKSLDAAVEAIISAYSEFRVRGRAHAGALSLQKYSHALSALRDTLSCADTACRPTTMSTIMIMMMIEMFLNISSMQHAGGAAQVLKCRGMRPPADQLEARILMTLRGPVSVQAIYLEESYFSDKEWAGIVSGFSAEDVDGTKSYFPHFAALARLFQKARRAFAKSPIDMQEIRELEVHVRERQQMVREQTYNLSADLTTHRLSNTSLNALAKDFSIDYFKAVREFGMCAMTCIFANNVEGALCKKLGLPYNDDNSRLCKDIGDLGTEVACSKPLGSCWFSMPLGLAYTASKDEAEKERFLDMIAEFGIHATGGVSEAARNQIEEFGVYLRLETSIVPSPDLPAES